VIVLLETWMEEKGWDKMRDKLPGGYVWKVQNKAVNVQLYFFYFYEKFLFV